MKLTTLLTIVVLFFWAFAFIGCDKTDPISLGGITEVSIYPDTGAEDIDISGGDGSYSAISNDPDIVHAEIINAATLRLSPLSVGTTMVIISDRSGNNSRIVVTVSYRTTEAWVSGMGVIVEGVGDEEKEEIEELALDMFPVMNGGGYLFTYTNEIGMGGKTIIYPGEFGWDGIETTFEIVTHDKYDWEEVYGWQAYQIVINNKERVFMIGPRAAIKSSGPFMGSFLEDLTPLFKDDYPAVERVIAVQPITVLGQLF